jgi:hypothetical protein
MRRLLADAAKATPKAATATVKSAPAPEPVIAPAAIPDGPTAQSSIEVGDIGVIPWPPSDIEGVAAAMARNPKQAAELVNALVPLLQGTHHPVRFAPAQQKDIDATCKKTTANR